MRRASVTAALFSFVLLFALVAPASGARPCGSSRTSSIPQFPPGQHLVASFPYGLVQAEPSIRVDSGGRIYVIAPGSTPIGCEVWIVSADGRSSTFHTPPDLGVGGGDCDLAVSSSIEAGGTYPTVAYSSLSLADLTVGKSIDGGATFSSPNLYGSQIVGDDRQWNAWGEGSTVYMSYHILATNNIAVARSTDGGQNYLERGLAIDLAHIPQAIYNNELGAIVVNNASTLSPRPVYTIFTAPPTAAENLNTAVGEVQTANHGVYLAASYDGGATWTDYTIYVGPATETYDHIFPALAVDAGGNFWAAWASEHHIFVSHANAGTLGQSGWSTPIQIDNTGSGANVFPWLVGGGPNRADLVWYAGTGVDNNDTTNSWNVGIAQLSVNNKGADSVTQAVASDHIIHHGQICTTGEGCTVGGDRTLLDFFQVALTPDGRAAIAWADDSETAGVAQIYVTVQCAGISATTGKSLRNTC
ncbi:MAG: hypothetical protein ACXVQX_04485 [Actinomycetota bacterium]